MATKTTRKSGENHQVAFGATPLGTARATQMRLSIRTADGRGSGDAGPVDKEIGLDSGEVIASYLITDEATLALLGSYDTVVITDSAGTTVFSGDALFADVTRREAHDQMTLIDARFVVQGLPTVPDLTGLAFA